MKDYEHRSRYFLPRRAYTLVRLDGKSFHTYTRHLKKPFDMDLISDMQKTTLYLCENIQGCKLGYTQSDEITLLLTDFDDIKTDAWFDGNLSKIVSISAAMATAKFNHLRITEKIEVKAIDGFELKSMPNTTLAFFDSRAWSLADPWEVFNTFLWRQQDATRNSIQMVAQSLYSQKQLMNKNTSMLQEMIFAKGQNYNDYLTVCKRGTFFYKDTDGWVTDREMPILTQDKDYFFSKIPMMKGTCE